MKHLKLVPFLILAGLVLACEKDFPKNEENVEADYQLERVSQRELDELLNSIEFTDSVKFAEKEEPKFIQRHKSLIRDLKR